MAGLSTVGEEYPAGRYKVWGLVQYTNREIGMMRIRLGFGC